MPLLVDTLVDPSSTPIVGALAKVRLRTNPNVIGAPGYNPAEDTTIGLVAETSTSDTGSYTFTLDPNSVLMPPNTWYEITFSHETDAWGIGPVAFVMPATGGPYTLFQILGGGPVGGPPTLTSITITPAGASVAPGSTVAFRAIGHYNDGTTADITNICNWSSSNTAFGTVSNTTGTKGTVTGVAEGGIAITATEPLSTVSAFTLCSVTAGAPPPIPPFIGGSQVRYMGTTNADLDRMKANGCKWVRLTVDLSIVGAAGNTGNPVAGIDNTIAGGAARFAYAKSIGLNVLAVITFAPTWLTGGSGTTHKIPQTSGLQDNWCQIAAAFLASSTGASIDAVEIWNEINHDPFNSNPTMATIRPFMKKAVLALRAARPSVKLGPSGMASAHSKASEAVAKWDAGTSNLDNSISPATCMDGMYHPTLGLVGGTTAGTAYVDFWVIHGYTGAGDPAYNTPENELYHCFRKMPGVGDFTIWGGANQAASVGFTFRDDILVAHGDGAKSIWQAEGGWFGGGPGLDEGAAANNMQIGLAWWRGWQNTGSPPYAGVYFNFEEYDQAGHTIAPDGTRIPISSNTEDYLGLRRKEADGTYTDKPQASVWRAFTAN